MSTLKFIQDTAAVGGGAAGRRVSQAGGCVDCDAHGILVLNPGDQGAVGDTVQGVVLYHWSAGGWVGYSQDITNLSFSGITWVR